MKKRWYRFWFASRPAPVVDLEDPVGGALKDAQVLIAFAAQSRHDFKKQSIGALTEASETVAAKRAAGVPPTAAELARFWNAYDDLAVDAAPASAQSIRASIAFGERRLASSLIRLPNVMGLLALVVAIASVALQGFWGAGHDLLTDVALLELKVADQRVRIQNNIAARDRRDEQRRRLYLTLCPASIKCDRDAYPVVDTKKSRSTHAAPLANPSEGQKLHAEFQMADADFADKAATVRELVEQLKRIEAPTEQLALALGQWHQRSRIVCTIFYGLCPIQQDERTDGLRLAETRLPARPAAARPIHMASLEPLASLAALDNETPERAATPSDPAWRKAFQNDVQQARVIVDNFGGYWIPMVMGVLGAMTFILRALTVQLREHTYVPRTMSIGLTRICLGAVAGVFGSLLAPTTEGALKGLPPVFVPFVFGYGIEILFSLMDKLVTSFTQGDTGAVRAKVAR